MDAAFGIYTDSEIQLLICDHAKNIEQLAWPREPLNMERYNGILREADRILFLCKSMQLTAKRTRS